MAEKSAFRAFVPFLWKHLQGRYPFVAKLDRPFCVAIPKASSFHCGVSPTYGKHVIFSLQPSPKAWEAGQFHLCVHVSQAFAPTPHFSDHRRSYAAFEDGWYMLAADGDEPVTTWCLQPGDRGLPRRPYSFEKFWEPSTYEPREAMFAEAAPAVAALLEARLFRKAGFAWPGSG